MMETAGVFVSSPDDIATERAPARAVIARLRGGSAGRLAALPIICAVLAGSADPSRVLAGIRGEGASDNAGPAYGMPDHRLELRGGDPGDTEWRRDLAAGYERIGNLRRQGGDHAGAAGSYREALDLIAGHAAGDAGHPDRLLDMILLRQKLAKALGDMAEALGDKADPRRRAEAEAMAAKAVEESRALVGEDPARPAWRAALASSLNLHARLVATGRPPEPEAAATAVRQAQEALALSDGPSPEYLDTLAAARFAAGAVIEALRTGRKALDLCIAANPGDLTGICLRISGNLRRMRANAEALALQP